MKPSHVFLSAVIVAFAAIGDAAYFAHHGHYVLAVFIGYFGLSIAAAFFGGQFFFGAGRG